MEELGIPFECQTSDCDENMATYEDPGKLAKHLALQKARYMAKKFKETVIIGADTFVMVGKKKIGKPDTISEAKKIIQSMSNKTVEVHSGVAVVKTGKKGGILQEKTAHVVTDVSFTNIGKKDIEGIVKKDEVLSTSGAFSIEGEGGKFVKNIRGDYHNIIGLPLFQLKQMLKEVGVKLP